MKKSAFLAALAVCAAGLSPAYAEVHEVLVQNNTGEWVGSLNIRLSSSGNWGSNIYAYPSPRNGMAHGDHHRYSFDDANGTECFHDIWAEPNGLNVVTLLNVNFCLGGNVNIAQ